MRNNTQNPKMMMEYFELYKVVVDKFEIQLEDQWNFDRTRYCMGIDRKNWVISINIV